MVIQHLIEGLESRKNKELVILYFTGLVNYEKGKVTIKDCQVTGSLSFNEFDTDLELTLINSKLVGSFDLLSGVTIINSTVEVITPCTLSDILINTSTLTKVQISGDGNKVEGSTITEGVIHSSKIKSSNINTSTITSSIVSDSDIDDECVIDTSSITLSDISFSTEIVSSSVTGSKDTPLLVSQAKITNSTIENCANVDSSTIDKSTIMGSSVTGSVINGSSVEGSNVSSESDIKNTITKNSILQSSSVDSSIIEDSTLSKTLLQSLVLIKSCVLSGSIVSNLVYLSNVSCTDSTIKEGVVILSTSKSMMMGSTITRSNIEGDLDIVSSTVTGVRSVVRGSGSIISKSQLSGLILIDSDTLSLMDSELRVVDDENSNFVLPVIQSIKDLYNLEFSNINPVTTLKSVGMMCIYGSKISVKSKVSLSSKTSFVLERVNSDFRESLDSDKILTE